MRPSYRIMVLHDAQRLYQTVLCLEQFLFWYRSVHKRRNLGIRLDEVAEPADLSLDVRIGAEVARPVRIVLRIVVVLPEVALEGPVPFYELM